MIDFQKDLDSVKIEEILDINLLQEVQDAFYNAFKITTLAINPEGKFITRASGFTPVCNKIKSCPAGISRCMESNRVGGVQAGKQNKPYVYECFAGFCNFAAPIMVEGRSVGSMIGSQVIISGAIDEGKLRRTASELGIDPDELMDLARSTPQLDHDKIGAIATLLGEVASSIAHIGAANYRLRTVANYINDKITAVSASMEELSATANNVTQNQEELNNGIREVNEISGKINEFTSLIKDIAKQTRLLGLNASIEAARAGTAGAGFSVVAEEIGKLAGNSSDTVDKIQNITSRITQAVNETVRRGDQTTEFVRMQTEAIEKSTMDLVELGMYASDLYELSN